MDRRDTYLKYLAMLTMVIDHVGFLFFPQIIAFRAIGRISFVLFAFSVGKGALRSHNIWMYAARLTLLAIISQPIYYLTFGAQDYNIFITLLLGLAGTLFVHRNLGKLLTTRFILISLVSLFVLLLLPIQYGVTGVLSIIAWSFFGKYPKSVTAAQAILWLLYWATHSLAQNSAIIFSITQMPTLQIIAVIVSVGIYLIYNYFPSRKFVVSKNPPGESFAFARWTSYLWYFFYPLHLLILHLIARSF